jgi:predicted negative regulator of RcsB-dependent stress response
MMDIYASDEEKGEAIKQWWRENGLAVVVGVALGIAAIFGSRYWFSYQDQKTERAAVLYQQTLVTLNDDDLQLAQANVAELQSDFASTPYAVFAAIEMATQLANKENLDAAIEQLQWVIDNAELAAQRDMARSRLARLNIDADQLDNALAITDSAETVGFAAVFAELQGDIYAAQENDEEAYKAYQSALNSVANNGPRYGLLQMKRDDVAVQ